MKYLYCLAEIIGKSHLNYWIQKASVDLSTDDNNNKTY